MQRAYMLLRDNREKGPFTIDELMQQHLRRGDLVWIEGESHAWATPEEIPELKTQINKGKSRPDEIELRAEALRKRIMEYKPLHIEWKKGEQNLPPVNLEEPSFEFVDHRRRGVKMYDVLSLFLVSGFAAVLYYGGKELYNNRAVLSMESPTSTASIVKPEERIVLSAPQQPSAAYAPLPDSTITITDSLQQMAVIPIKKSTKKPQLLKAISDSNSAQQSVAINASPALVQEKDEEKEKEIKEEPKKETERERETVKIADTTSKKEDVTSTPKKKKKGLFKAIFGGKD